MARQRELLSLVDIADETGISYATLRNYALKFGDEIPSEGSGRNTRYPRLAVKVFQRLRKESKPGRKPANASPAQALATPSASAFTPFRQETASRFPASVAPAAPAPLAPASVAAPAMVDNKAIEKELVAMRGYLASIAESLKLLVSATESNAPAPAAPAVAPAPAPAAAEPAAAPAPATTLVGASVPLPELRDSSGGGGSDKAGHRRLQSMPKVWGQRGRRPE